MSALGRQHDPDEDCGQRIREDWCINSGPVWVLLDAERKAIDVRLPSAASIEQLNQMLEAVANQS